MTLTLGRCSGLIETNRTVTGDMVSIEGVTPEAVYDVLCGYRQQLLGLVDNEDEDVVPCVSSTDATFDGFYRPVSMSTSYIGTQADGAFSFSAVLERITGFANPWLEVTTQSLVRTNGHAVTAPVAIIGTTLTVDGYFYDLRPNLTAATDRSRTTQTGGATNTLQAKLVAAPTTLTQYRFATSPAKFYVGACTVEVKYGSTWYPVTGRSFPAGRLWRIANDYVRLTAATTTTTDGTFEVWDNTAAAWESVTVAHWDNTGVSGRIGYPGSAAVQTVSVLRNSPEHVVVKVSGNNLDFSYSLQRGHGQVTTSFTSSTAARHGTGFGTASGAACTAFTGGVRQTASNAAGNRMVFGTAAANTNDVINGAAYLTTAATTGSAWWGVDLGGVGVTPATDLRDEFLGAVSWTQRIVVR